jgi:hypothetical protein
VIDLTIRSATGKKTEKRRKAFADTNRMCRQDRGGRNNEKGGNSAETCCHCGQIPLVPQKVIPRVVVDDAAEDNY